EFRPESVDLEALCRQIIATLIETTGTTHKLMFAPQGDCTDIVVDPKLMEQMIEELLSNAVKYSEAGSRVDLDLSCINNEIVIRVKDGGIGIPESDFDQIFEPFHRAANVGHASGTGLGLAVVQEVVELHKGSIDFESHEGKGTTFIVILPQPVK